MCTHVVYPVFLHTHVHPFFSAHLVHAQAFDTDFINYMAQQSDNLICEADNDLMAEARVRLGPSEAFKEGACRAYRCVDVCMCMCAWMCVRVCGRVTCVHVLA